MRSRDLIDYLVYFFYSGTINFLDRYFFVMGLFCTLWDFSSIPGLSTLDANSNCPPTLIGYDNQNCHQAWPNVSWGAKSPVERHWFKWMTKPGWAATIWAVRGVPTRVGRSGWSLLRPTGTTQDSSGTPAPHISRSWLFAKHEGRPGSWFYLYYRLLFKALWSFVATQSKAFHPVLRSQTKNMRKRHQFTFALIPQHPNVQAQKPEWRDPLLLEASSKINFFGLPRRKRAPKGLSPRKGQHIYK